MKNVIYFLFAGCAMISCDDRLDFLVDLNEPPTIAIIQNGIEYSTVFSDSVKTSVKFGNSPYPVVLISKDPEKYPVSITYLVQEGKVSIRQNDEEVTKISAGLDGLALINIEPQQPGSHKIIFAVTDNLGNRDEVDLIINSFVNLAPVAVLDLTKISVNAALEYDLVGNRSYDRDTKQGGGILFFEWDINGSKFISETPTSRFIFPSSGTYEVKLRVQDNNGTFSPLVSRILTIN